MTSKQKAGLKKGQALMKKALALHRRTKCGMAKALKKVAKG
jgi:hypothetical protein